MENENQERVIDFAEILAMLRRRLPAILLCTVIAAGIGFAATFFRAKPTPAYTASALMIVSTQQGTAAEVTSDQLDSAARLVATYSIVVRSDAVLQPVIDTLGLPYTCEELTGRGIVKVATVDSTQVMQVTVTLPDREQARQICEQITLIAPDIMMETVGMGSVKVISQVTTSQQPLASSPSVKRSVVMMALLGMFGCIGVLLVGYMLSNKTRNAQDIAQYLGLRVLSVIPMCEEEKK